MIGILQTVTRTQVAAAGKKACVNLTLTDERFVNSLPFVLVPFCKYVNLILLIITMITHFCIHLIVKTKLTLHSRNHMQINSWRILMKLSQQLSYSHTVGVGKVRVSNNSRISCRICRIVSPFTSQNLI